LISLNNAELRTVPTLRFSENEAQSSLFFRESGQNLELIKDHKLKLKEFEDRLGPPKEVLPKNTRFPIDFSLKQK